MGNVLIVFLDTFVAKHGYITMALAMYLEGLGLPIPSELLFIPAGFLVHSHELALPHLIFASSVGAVAGNLTGYAAGRWGGRRFLQRFGPYLRLGEEQLDQVAGWFTRYGRKTIFVSRFVGFIRAAAIVSAGIGRMPVLEFAGYQFLAALVWNGLWAIAAWRLGRRIDRLTDRFGVPATLVVGAVLLLAVGLLWWWQSRKRRRN